MKLDIDKLDFEHCNEEPIHIPESIQGYGYLFALGPDDGEIRIISENVKELLNREFDDIVGRNFFGFLQEEEDTDFLIETYNRAKKKQTRLPLQLKFEKKFIHGDQANDFLAVVYDSGEYFVIELEPAGKFRQTYSARHFIKMYAMTIVPKFDSFTDLSQMAQEIVDTIKDITEMDRVVLYRFNEDASGKVIAESREEDMDSYLGLYYPASDIPSQARELYTKNWVRLTPNVDLEASPLIPTTIESKRKPLDMTYSILRSLSPIHHQYIRNQGLKASLSLSLVTHGNLWGIISCHSKKPTYVPQNVRLECETLSQLFSWHLYAKEEELYIAKKERTERAIENILDKSSRNNPIVDVFKQNENEVLDVMEADGFLFHTEEETISLGTIPHKATIQELVEMTFKNGRKSFISSDITEKVSDEKQLNGIKGVLIIPFTENKKYFTAWFRKETIIHQKWAGVPNEKRATGSKRERLTPRSSFKVHEMTIRGTSTKWTKEDEDVAFRFNKVFMAHALERQEDMRDNISNLELQSRYKNEFLATLAHELRNPLTPVYTGLDILSQENDPEVKEKILSSMKKQVGHMSTIINDLMDVARISQGKLKLDKQPVTIQEVVSNAIEICDGYLRERKHTLHTDIPGEELWINGDKTRLSQIFINILNNACKYTEPGGRIELSMEYDPKNVVVRIKDNGRGIPKDKTDAIFTMFSQVDAFSVNAKGGLGIGLTLVKKLVFLHKGDIMVRSEGVGMGSEFEVSFPLDSKVSQQEELFDKKDNDSAEKPKVMIVDDNRDLIQMFEIMMKKEGYQTGMAYSAGEALDVFRKFKPNIAVLDIGLPDMDGYELCKKLSAMPEANGTIFLSQSGWSDKRHVQKSKESGFKEHLIKPFNMEDLKEVLSRYLEDK